MLIYQRVVSIGPLCGKQLTLIFDPVDFSFLKLVGIIKYKKAVSAGVTSKLLLLLFPFDHNGAHAAQKP